MFVFFGAACRLGLRRYLAFFVACPHECLGFDGQWKTNLERDVSGWCTGMPGRASTYVIEVVRCACVCACAHYLLPRLLRRDDDGVACVWRGVDRPAIVI